MAKVLLCTTQEGQSPLEHTIFKREDIDLNRMDNEARAFIKLKAIPHDLFIWEQSLEKSDALVYLNHIQKACGDTDLKVICFWKETPPEDLPPIVLKSFTHPPDDKEYYKILSDCLKTRVRKSRRVLIRLRLAIQQTGQGMLCSTVNVSREGILIESNKPLEIDSVYLVTFLGLKGRSLPPFKTKIIRKDTAPRGNLSLRYYAGLFFEVPKTQTEALAESLNL